VAEISDIAKRYGREGYRHRGGTPDTFAALFQQAIDDALHPLQAELEEAREYAAQCRAKTLRGVARHAIEHGWDDPEATALADMAEKAEKESGR